MMNKEAIAAWREIERQSPTMPPDFWPDVVRVSARGGGQELGFVLTREEFEDSLITEMFTKRLATLRHHLWISLTWEKLPAGVKPAVPVGQSIGWAVKQMQDGHKVRRAGWNGKGMWLALQVPDANSKMGLPYVYMSTVTGQFVPWLCSQTDLLAVDWEFAA